MIFDLLHIPLTAAACFLLWKLWSSLAGRGRASLIIALGFLIRAFGGQVLFWISYLRLPVAPSLQLGDGFWFFAVDGPGMLDYTRELILSGPAALLLTGRAIPSHAFIQVFTVLAWMFGTFASVAILLNCAAFLGTCAIILRLGQPSPGNERPRLVALAAMAFGPGAILWSLQLLKDTFLIFLLAAMIACCFSWQELWRGTPIKWRRLLLAAGAMLAVLYVMAGIRWYLAFFFWVGWSIFGLLTALAARKKVVAILANAFFFVLLAQVVRLGGAWDVLPSAQRILDPRPSIAATFRPTTLTKDLAGRRYGFENTPGATTIIAGRALEQDHGRGGETTRQQSAPPVVSTQQVQPTPRVESTQPVQSTQRVESTHVQSVQSAPPVKSAKSVQPTEPTHVQPTQSVQSVQSPQSEPSTQSVQSPPSVQPTQPVQSTQVEPVPSAQTVPPAQSAQQVQSVPRVPAPQVPPTQPVQSAQSVQPTPAQHTPHVQATHHVAHVQTTTQSAQPVQSTQAEQPTQSTPHVQPEQPAPYVDKTIEPHPIAKTMAGLSAEFLPRSIAQALGLIHIGGGRGFWLFAEVDTLVLDALLIVSIILCARSLRTHSRITPLFVLLLIVFLATAGPLAYTVNNFGTLFRLRQMIYAILAFLPLTLGTRANAA